MWLTRQKEECMIAVENEGHRDNNPKTKKRGKRPVVTMRHGSNPLQGVPEHSAFL
jgi:hypothetical protein